MAEAKYLDDAGLGRVWTRIKEKLGIDDGGTICITNGTFSMSYNTQITMSNGSSLLLQNGGNVWAMERSSCMVMNGSDITGNNNAQLVMNFAGSNFNITLSNINQDAQAELLIGTMTGSSVVLTNRVSRNNSQKGIKYWYISYSGGFKSGTLTYNQSVTISGDPNSIYLFAFWVD